jgi:hypothetical protein
VGKIAALGGFQNPTSCLVFSIFKILAKEFFKVTNNANLYEVSPELISGICKTDFLSFLGGHREKIRRQ